MERCFSEMDALARGVEARTEALDGHSKVVTQQTILIARRLRILDKEIQTWLATGQMLDSVRRKGETSSSYYA